MFKELLVHNKNNLKILFVPYLNTILLKDTLPEWLPVLKVKPIVKCISTSYSQISGKVLMQLSKVKNEMKFCVALKVKITD